MQTVLALRRYPLKSALGETLQAVDLEPTGLSGDRTWACVDDQDNSVGSAKHPRRWGSLLQIGTALHDGELTLHLGSATVRAGSAAADAALTSHVGRPVRLTRTAPAGAHLHRVMPDDPGMVPTWLPDTRPGDEFSSAVGGLEHLNRFVDFGAVHLVTTGDLSRLAERRGGAEVPASRFRPNLILDLPADPPAGTELRLGDAVLRIAQPTPRCIVPGLGHGPLPADKTVLHTLARHYRTEVPGIGHAACFGRYAEVIRPGRLEVGQEVR